MARLSKKRARQERKARKAQQRVRPESVDPPLPWRARLAWLDRRLGVESREVRDDGALAVASLLLLAIFPMAYLGEHFLRGAHYLAALYVVWLPGAMYAWVAIHGDLYTRTGRRLYVVPIGLLFVVPVGTYTWARLLWWWHTGE